MFVTPSKDGSLAADFKNSAHEAGNDLQSAANQAGRKIRGLYNSASDELSHASDKVTGEIRTNPIRSTVIALGVGALLGALLRR